MSRCDIQLEYLGRADYYDTWQAMKDYTAHRDDSTRDRIWVTEHEAVFTQGLNGKPEHVLNPQNIPVIQIDRGGQVTYHGPGQLVVYCLLDLNRLGLGVRGLVSQIENSLIELLQCYAITAQTRAGAPGVYVAGAKIAALGLRIRKGCCYHGLSLNVDMDLEPFSRINPCGLGGLAVTQMSDLCDGCSLSRVGEELAEILIRNFSGQKKSGSSRR